MISDVPTVMEYVKLLKENPSLSSEDKACPFAALFLSVPISKSSREDGLTIFEQGASFTSKKTQKKFFLWFDGPLMMVRCFKHLAEEVGNEPTFDEVVNLFADSGEGYEFVSGRCHRYKELVEKKCSHVGSAGWIDFIRTGFFATKDTNSIENIKQQWQPSLFGRQWDRKKRKSVRVKLTTPSNQDELDRLKARYGTLETHLEVERVKRISPRDVDRRMREWEREKVAWGLIDAYNNPEFKLILEWTDYAPCPWLEYINKPICVPMTPEEYFSQINWDLYKHYNPLSGPWEQGRFSREWAYLVPEEYRTKFVSDY